MLKKTGILLVNLGTPEAPNTQAVRQFLREFLSDPCVISLPTPLRWLLLNLFILPFRPQKTKHAYQAIWTPQGSPLKVYSQALQCELQSHLGSNYIVELGMRYGAPSLAKALDRLLENSACQTIQVIPLFPQYATATTGSIQKVITQHIAQHARKALPATPKVPVTFCHDFFENPHYINAIKEIVSPELKRLKPDILLISYHGLPVAQVQRCCNTRYPALHTHCASSPLPCPNQPINDKNRYCYRAQCYATSRHIAQALSLPPEKYVTGFQSRLGKTPWIQPYTDKILEKLAERGLQRIAVICPSFVTDCLETLEEIGIRAKEQWAQLGGQALDLIPCLNAHPAWINALSKLCTQCPESIHINI